MILMMAIQILQLRTLALALLVCVSVGFQFYMYMQLCICILYDYMQVINALEYFTIETEILIKMHASGHEIILYYRDCKQLVVGIYQLFLLYLHYKKGGQYQSVLSI